MRSANAADLAQIGLASLSTLSKDESLLVCFRCHATKDAVQPDYIDGKPLERYFSLKLPILAKELHTPDGRVRSFSYQENHLFSDCYINGSMTCVDCHAPHALTYRDNFGRALQGRFDNGQCTGCHANLEETPELHSHHKSGSKGNLCVSCHMPYLQAQGIGDQITYGRSDHLIAIPRPEYDASIGIENACLKCHPDKSTEVLEEQTRAWYGEVKPLNILVRRLLEAKAVTDYDQASDLLLNSRPHHPIAQVTGLFEFLKRFMTVNMVSADEQVIGQLKAMSSSSDLDLRAFSMMALHFAYGQHSGVREFLADQLQSAAGDDAAIRGRWALALDYLGSRYAMSSQYDDAVACFEKAIEVRPDDPVVFSNLAKAHRDHGDNTAAIEAFRTAIQLQPASPRYYFQLAKTYAQMRRDTEAIQVLEQGLIRAPDDKSARRLLRQLRQQERL
jgi:tetratricopeptide (TPR) repeat protein